MSFQPKSWKLFFITSVRKNFLDITKLGLTLLKSFDSLREITDSMFPGAHKHARVFIRTMPRRSPL